MTHFDALANADWRGVMDLDPQQEPLVPEPVEEKDWRDLSFDARRSITNAERSEWLSMKRANLMIAQKQIALALEKLG